MLRDLLWGARWLRRNPLFTALVTATLALGIGANTAVFSVVDAVLLRPLPYRSPERLIKIEEGTVQKAWVPIPATHYLRWRERTDWFSGMAAFRYDVVTLTGIETPDQVLSMRVSPEVFPVLGVHARLGRVFTDADDAAGPAQNVVLSDKLWRRLFHGDPGVLGRTMRAGEEIFTVVGVMPPEFEFPSPDKEMWLPLRATPVSTESVMVLARLRDGVTLAHVNSGLAASAGEFERADPVERAGLRVTASAWSEDVGRKSAQSLIFILAAVGLLLLIACANVASLMLSRAVERQKEIAVRACLGAGFWRVMRQLLAESVVLALLGSAAGIALATLLLRAGAPNRAASGGDAASPASHDHRPGAGFQRRGLSADRLPVQRGPGPDGLPDGPAVGPAERAIGRRGARVHAAFLAVDRRRDGAGLSPAHRRRTDGAQPHPPAAGRHGHPSGPRADHEGAGGERHAPAAARGARDQAPADGLLRALAEPRRGGGWGAAAAVVNNLPLSPYNTTVSSGWRARCISPHYFAVMGIPLVAGRAFGDSDQGSAPRVVIVNENLARRLFPDRSPVGQTIIDGGVAVTIVGVVRNAPQMSYDQPPEAEMYLPYQQVLFGSFLATIVVRTEGDPLALSGTLKKEVWAVNRDQPIVKVETMSDVIADAIWRPRFSSWVLSVISGLALLLMSAGVYGVIAYTVSLRTHEVGIRIALGATPGKVTAAILRDTMIPVAAGLTVSVAAALALHRLLAGLLFRVSGADPATYVLAGGVLLAIGVLAGARPAWKAGTSDPLDALRSE